MSDVIATYLARVESALWLKPRARREVIEELRGHLAQLDPPAASADDLAARFGEPAALACSIAAERPWWQTTAPWRPTIYLFAFVVTAGVAGIGLRGLGADGAAQALGWCFAPAVALAAALTAKRGARPVHAVLTALRPALLLVVLIGGLVAINGGVRMGWPVLASIIVVLAPLVLMSLALGLAPALAVSAGFAGRIAAVAIPPVAYLAAQLCFGANEIIATTRSVGSSSGTPVIAHAALIAVGYAVIGWGAARIAVGQRRRATA